MNTRIEKAIEIDTIGEVVFFADLSDFTIENDGIGSYEYWGRNCYDAGTDYLYLETINWDKGLYTEEQNLLIEDYLQENGGGDNCPYQQLCDLAEEPYADMVESEKEAYYLRNI